jgi:hypothetical protein
MLTADIAYVLRMLLLGKFYIKIAASVQSL